MSFHFSFEELAARLRAFIAASMEEPRGNRPQPISAVGMPLAGAFGQLALELFALQFAHNRSYHQFCEARGVSPQGLRHWSEIPAVPTSAFKELDLSCLVAAERTAVFHSSGTTEQRPSRHYHNPRSLAVYEASLLPWFEKHLMPLAGLSRWPMLSLTPPPAEAPHSSLVHMFETVRREFGAANSAFAGRVGRDGSWSLETEYARDWLERAVQKGEPVMLLGTAFSFVQLLDYLGEHEKSVRLLRGSRVLETGGYKGRSRALPKAELYALMSERLGVPRSDIVCEYGMSELSSQAYAGTGAAADQFRFPPWARVQIISPETGCEVAEGETGLIRIFDLANVYSVTAVQTEDLGIRRGGGFELLGRAALAEPRGCSLMPAR